MQAGLPPPPPSCTATPRAQPRVAQLPTMLACCKSVWTPNPPHARVHRHARARTLAHTHAQQLRYAGPAFPGQRAPRRRPPSPPPPPPRTSSSSPSCMNTSMASPKLRPSHIHSSIGRRPSLGMSSSRPASSSRGSHSCAGEWQIGRQVQPGAGAGRSAGGGRRGVSRSADMLWNMGTW